ncbi:hypothetical protein MMC31_004328, partial [Peltigera leucophlebia]|nr:hypothetical protein [Peltigera leucophlebia]
MPPRKSNLSQTATTGDEGTPSKDKERDGINIEDLALPRTMVQRLAKGVIPANTTLQKDAITAMSKSATLFVNYLAHAANISPAMGTRKTISPDAVLDALAELEFENFLPRVKAELRRFNELQTGKRNEYRRKLKEKEENGTGGATRVVKAVDNGEGDDDGDERAAKR